MSGQGNGSFDQSGEKISNGRTIVINQKAKISPNVVRIKKNNKNFL